LLQEHLTLHSQTGSGR